MNTAVIPIFDEWGFYHKKDQLTLDVNVDTEYNLFDDPIAILIQILGKDSSKWYDLTYKFEEVKNCIKNNTSINIEPFAREWSDKIRSYYKNKYFLNRFKNKTVSLFQQTVEAIITQGNAIKESQLRPLFKLPYFYLEDQAVEEVVKNSVCLNLNRTVELDDDFRFVTKIKRFGKLNDRYIRFLLQNSKKHLLSIIITENNTSFPLWNHLYETSSSINYKGYADVSKFKGTDFKFYSIANPAYTIRINKT